MGIDIFPEGPNPNDVGDFDCGPNELMNYPIVEYAAYNPAQDIIWIYGTLDTQSPENAVVELFVAKPDTVFNHGEGEIFLGRAICNAAGEWMFMGNGGSEDMLITATATSVTGSTSEFSKNYVTVTSLAEYALNNCIIYPNPANDYVVFSLPEAEMAKLAIYNTGGALIFEKAINGGKIYKWEIESNLQNGLYIANITTTNGTIITSKFNVLK